MVTVAFGLLWVSIAQVEGKIHTLPDEVLLEGFCVYECPDGDDFCDAVMFLALQISWVMVPIGQ